MKNLEEEEKKNLHILYLLTSQFPKKKKSKGANDDPASLPV